MGLCLAGLEAKLTSTTMRIHVAEDHPYILLANALDWKKMAELIIDDLKTSTATRLWWVGRKLQLRIHIGVFILQSLNKMTDRGIEEAIKSNGVYQVFCGKSVMDLWHCPDHAKIENFRNRISPQTQQSLVSYVAKVASDMKFADPSKMDVDSTVQEAGMSYPSDAHLLTKLACKCKKVSTYITGKRRGAAALDVDIKSVKKKAHDYFFIAKNKSKEIKRQAFKKLYHIVKQSIMPTVEYCMRLGMQDLKSLPWNIRLAAEQIQNHARKYLQDVSHFIKTNTIKPGKILSFHMLEVACINKGKVGKDREFGRVYQLGRIGGNFFIVLPSTSVRQDDKASLIPMVQEHEAIFGKDALKSLATDKGYYSKANEKALKKKIKQLGMQIPGNVKRRRTCPIEIKNRRAGIEPLIGHVKRFGLAKSNVKSDQTTLASGYRSVLGFNLHQLTRYLSGEAKTATT